MKSAFINIIVEPFYNALVLIMDFVTNDLGIAIIILTVIFRFILFPLFKSQIVTQIKMQQLQEPLKQIQEKYKNNREVLGREMLALYKKHKLNPFSGIIILFIQIPLLIGFYYVFAQSGLPNINQQLLYPFIKSPENINHIFIGLIDMTSKSYFLAILAGLTQFIQMKIIFSASQKKSFDNLKSKSEISQEVMKHMQTQMKYVMPILIVFIGYTLGSIVALYMVVGSIFSIFQELYIRKKIKEPEAERIRKEKMNNNLISDQQTPKV